MSAHRFAHQIDIGGGVKILGEKSFHFAEEDAKEAQELQHVQELTESI